MDIHFRDEWIDAWFAFMCAFPCEDTRFLNPVRHLSANRNITQKFIDEHPDFEWDWTYVSKNPNITWDWFWASDKQCNKVDISKHPNITLDIVLANPRYFDIHCIKHVARNPNVTMEMLKTHPYFTSSFGEMEYEWDWFWASDNPNITINDVIKNEELRHYGDELSKNKNMTFDFVVNNQFWWNAIYIVLNPSVCRFGMTVDEVKQLFFSTYRRIGSSDEINWFHMEIQCTYATMEFIDAIEELVEEPHDGWYFYHVSSNKHLTLQMIKNNINSNWCLYELFENDLHEDRENYVENQVCRMLLAMIYEEQRNAVCDSIVDYVFADEYLVKMICQSR